MCADTDELGGYEAVVQAGVGCAVDAPPLSNTSLNEITERNTQILEFLRKRRAEASGGYVLRSHAAKETAQCALPQHP